MKNVEKNVRKKTPDWPFPPPPPHTRWTGNYFSSQGGLRVGRIEWVRLTDLHTLSPPLSWSAIPTRTHLYTPTGCGNIKVKRCQQKHPI